MALYATTSGCAQVEHNSRLHAGQARREGSRDNESREGERDSGRRMYARMKDR